MEKVFFVSERILKSSNISGDTPGKKFVDLTLQVTNQKNTDLTLTVFSREGSISTGEGSGGFIIGEDNLFTIFVEQLTVRNDGSGMATTVNIYSGELTESGITNFEQVLILTDDFGDPSNVFIEIGEGRHIIDSDGFSPVIDEDITNGRVGIHKGNSQRSVLSSN